MDSIGIKYPIEKTKDGMFGKTYTTVDNNISNINVLLRTNEGEIPFDYNFGLPLLSSLFEQASDDFVDTLKSIIKNKIRVYVPGVNINSIDITTEENTVLIKLRFSSKEDPLSIQEVNIGI